MSLILQQIFYAHDGQTYQIFHSGTLSDNIVINNAVESVCDRLKNRDEDGVFCGNFEDGKYHYWFQSSPGKKDYSGRATIILHILLCECSDVSAEMKEKDFFFYSKLQKECPAEKLIADLTVTDEELRQIPSVICQNDDKKFMSQKNGSALPSVNHGKSKYKLFILILLFLIITAAVVSAGAGFVAGKDNGYSAGIKANAEHNRNTEKQMLKGFAEKLGITKESPEPKDINDAIERLRKKKETEKQNNGKVSKDKK